MCRDYYWIQVEKHDLAERLKEKNDNQKTKMEHNIIQKYLLFLLSNVF